MKILFGAFKWLLFVGLLLWGFIIIIPYGISFASATGNGGIVAFLIFLFIAMMVASGGFKQFKSSPKFSITRLILALLIFGFGASFL